MTIRESRQIRKAIQQSAIYTLQRKYSRVEIGQMIGYKDGQVIDKVMQRDNTTVVNGDAQLILSRLASDMANDVIADAHSNDDKSTVPISWKIDGCLHDEIVQITQGFGVASMAFESGDGPTVLEQVERGVRAALGARTEAYHRFAPVPQFCGDGR